MRRRPIPGKHLVTAIACYEDVDVGQHVSRDDADSGGLHRRPDADGSMLGAESGLATDPFSATYSTGEAAGDVCLPEARFFWDGQAVGDPVAIDPTTCSATLDLDAAPEPSEPGTHRVTAQACDGDKCVTSTRAGATYDDHCEPEPTATPSPTPTPDAVAGAIAVGRAPSAVTRRRRRRRRCHPTPTPSAPPSPSPSPTPSPERDYVPAIVDYVGGPPDDGIDPAVVATNLWLTLLIVFLFGLTAEIFNSTMDAHRDEVHGWWLRLMRGPLGFLGSLTVPGASLTRLAGSGRIGSVLRVLAVLSLLGLIYSFLSPDFGLNSQTLVLFVSLVVGLGFLTYFSEGSTTRLAHRRYRADASVRLYGTAILVSIFAVVLSRLVTFQPGLVYGFVASAVIVAPVALSRRDDATLVLWPALGLLVVSVLAWLLLGPVRVAAAGGALVPALAETILAMIVIGGLETLFVSMLPLRFMDGATVMRWNRLAWALAFGAVTFLWWQLLLNQDHAYVEALEQTNVQVVLATVAVFMLTTGGLWSYFRFRPSRTGAEA